MWSVSRSGVRRDSAQPEARLAPWHRGPEITEYKDLL
jgi:hypothetical protein